MTTRFHAPCAGRWPAAAALSLAALSLFALLAALLAAPARADTPPAPQGVVDLTASATLDVTKDLLSVTLNTRRDGPDAGGVQTQLKQALDAALTEAKKVARPGQVDVRTGGFNISPRYTDKGVANGWQGSAELVIDGRDMLAIGQLTGRITTLTIARVGYDISRELREKSEAEVAAQAIARYRARAADYAAQFGYASFAIREVTVSTNDSAPSRPMPMMAMKAMTVGADEALPVEAGKGSVTVNVSGSVQLSR